ncbi:MAG: hypothetical protein AAB514_01815 [Patescibacteria group bacterium]
MTKHKSKRLLKENYLQMIKNSPKTRMFRNFFLADENGKKSDILKDGDLACAFFVSCVLKIFSLIDYPHATVDGAIKDMLENGWRRTKKLEPGNILLWEKNKKGHRHLGFYIGDKKAVSNFYEKRYPAIHHYINFWKTGANQPERAIEQIFTHPGIK